MQNGPLSHFSHGTCGQPASSGRRTCRVLLTALLGLPWAVAVAAEGGAPTAFTLAEEGVARCQIVVSSNAHERVLTAAVELAEMLQRISGAVFEVRTGTNAAAGLVVGAAGDFTNLPPDFVFASGHPLRREEYRLRTHSQGMWLIGATEQAVEHAVWDFLGRLGYRLYFLTDTWEVVPKSTSLQVALDAVEAPDYHTRDAPRGAPWSNGKLWQRWHKRNRTAPAFRVSTGHAYDGIIRANREAFAAHPEYYSLVNGERLHAGRTDGGGNVKFCISNPGLRQVVVAHAIRCMEADHSRESISMDPSDGSGWCTCGPCEKIGGPSDRVLLLANEVAEAINALGLGPRYVGIYAYNQHSPPPSITAHSNVVVSVATSFIRGGYTVEELVEGWRSKGAVLGVRDYHDVFPWSHDMPRRARGGSLAYLEKTIPYFYSQGVRFMNSENGDSWGANGLGYWITTRLLWRIEEAENVDALVDDFTTRAFGPAAAPMRRFCDLTHRDRTLMTAEHVVAMMYRHLDEARGLAVEHADVMARLDDLTLYTRYCELYNAYRQASGDARQAGFEALLRHTYRMRDRMMLSTVAICHRDRYRDRAMVIPPEADWKIPEEQNPWKDSTPFVAEEITALLQSGIASNQPVVLDFQAVAFERDLVPATRLTLPTNAPAGILPLTGRGLRKFLMWFEAPRKLPFEVTGGLIAGYRDRGNVKLRLLAEQEATLDAVAADDSVPPDGEKYTVTLSSPHVGLHTLEVSDGSDRTALALPEGPALCVESSLDERARLEGRWTLYCYVPRGTQSVGGYATSGTGRLHDGAGNVVFDFGTMSAAGYFNVPVPAGQDGAFWRFEQCAGERMLMTIPPYLAAHPSELLLPAAVVARDAPPAPPAAPEADKPAAETPPAP